MTVSIEFQNLTNTIMKTRGNISFSNLVLMSMDSFSYLQWSDDDSTAGFSLSAMNESKKEKILYYLIENNNKLWGKCYGGWLLLSAGEMCAFLSF